jgi:hypothetical protein
MVARLHAVATMFFVYSCIREILTVVLRAANSCAQRNRYNRADCSSFSADLPKRENKRVAYDEAVTNFR